MENLREKLQNYTMIWNVICDVLEFVIAVLVTIAIVASIISLIPGLQELIQSGHAAEEFSEYLEELFSCVIGIEFLKMLCHPNSDNVLETLIFLVARHMILSATSPKDNLVSVCTIVLLVLIRRLMDRNNHYILNLPFLKQTADPLEMNEADSAVSSGACSSKADKEKH